LGNVPRRHAKERGFNPARIGGTGPEFSCDVKGTRIYVEAVAPGPGEGNDRVPEPKIGVATYVPTEKILLRFTNAISQKRKQYLAAVAKRVVTEEACYLVAINSRGVPHAPYGNTLPFFIQALLPIGAPTLEIDRATGNTVDSYFAFRDTVPKAAGAQVSTASFS